MDGLTGIGAALVAMRPDDDGRRYEGSLVLSALPHAPTTAHRPTYLDRLRRLVRIGERVWNRLLIGRTGLPAGCGVRPVP